MYNQAPIATMRLWTAKAIDQAGTFTSVAIDLRSVAQGGTFSIEYIIAATGSPTLLIEYLLCSTKDGTFLKPSGETNIVTAAAKGSDLLSFAPELAPFMKIKVTENNVAAIASLDLWINFQ